MNSYDPQATLQKTLANLRFWRPHFSSGNGAVEHLPTLVWLSTMIRPSNVVYLGVGQGDGYFALCQVLGDTSSHVTLRGVDTWQDPVTNVPSLDIPEKLKNHNLTNYARYSRLFLSDASAAPELVDDSKIDLIVVEQELAPDVVNALRDGWLSALSPGGVIALLNRGSATRHAESEDILIDLAGSMPSLDIPVAPSITLLFPGMEPSHLLATLRLQSNDPDTTFLLMEYLALLGSTLAAAMASETFRSELDLRRAENAAFRLMLDSGDGVVQSLPSQIEHIAATVDALMISRDKTMKEQAERILEFSASETKLRLSLAEREEEYFTTKRALDRSTIQIEELKNAAGRMNEKLRKAQQELIAARSYIGDMYASTSWRVTAPIRMIKRTVTGRQ